MNSRSTAFRTLAVMSVLLQLLTATSPAQAEDLTVWEVIEAYAREAAPRMSASAQIRKVFSG